MVNRGLERMTSVQYHGDNHITQTCIDAIVRLLHFNDVIDLARLITFQNHHAFLLTVNEYQKIVIKPGFVSGYSGESAEGLANVVQLLRLHQVELEEVNVSEKLFSRIENGQLRDKDLQKIEALPYVRPLRLWDYVYHIGELSNEKLQRLYPSAIPWATLDTRILDLALVLDKGDSGAVLQAFNRFETLLKDKAESKVRTIGDAANEVFSKDSAEVKFLRSVFTKFRNPRAHEEHAWSRQEDIRCFVLLNELFLMENGKV